jgi:DNA polymerase III delta prime subunit
MNKSNIKQIKDGDPWIEKYRPKTLSDVSDHKHIIDILNSFKPLPNKNGVIPYNMVNTIFYGAPGVGKTSTILAYAKDIYGKSFARNVLELNASDERGINTIREKLPNFIERSTGNIKLIILDEADSMTPDAQAALKKFMDINKDICRFCIICNDISKIDSAIISRCCKFMFNELSIKSKKEKISKIIEIEDIQIDDNATNILLSLIKDFRHVIIYLQCLNNYAKQKNTKGIITEEIVRDYICHPSDDDINYIHDILTDKQISIPERISLLTEKILHGKSDFLNILELLVDKLINEISSSSSSSSSSSNNNNNNNSSGSYSSIIRDISNIISNINSAHNLKIELFNLILTYNKNYK